MAKVPRLHVEGAVFYVTSRGDNNEAIFKDDADFAMYVELLKKYIAQYQCTMFAFALLPNHLHLLLELKEKVTISDIMHDLNANYTKFFNAKYDRKGHLFQERNKMALLEKAVYLAKATAYIHLNSAQLDPGSDPSKYAFSSLPIYMGEKPGQLGAGLVGDAQIKEVLQAAQKVSYREYLAGLRPDEMQELSKSIGKNGVLGSDEFVAMANRKAQEHKAQLEPGKPGIMQRNFVLAGTGVIIVLLLVTFTLYQKSRVLKDAVKKEVAAQEVSAKRHMAQERVKIVRSLDEKYRADMVSYAAMAKRLELEKDKIKQLESKGTAR